MEDLFLEWVDLDPTDPAHIERARSIHEQVKALRYIVGPKLRLRTETLVAPALLDARSLRRDDLDYLDSFPEQTRDGESSEE